MSELLPWLGLVVPVAASWMTWREIHRTKRAADVAERALLAAEALLDALLLSISEPRPDDVAGFWDAQQSVLDEFDLCCKLVRTHLPRQDGVMIRIGKLSADTRQAQAAWSVRASKEKRDFNAISESFDRGLVQPEQQRPRFYALRRDAAANFGPIARLETGFGHRALKWIRERRQP